MSETQQEQFKLTFEFTEQEINAVLAALQELPGKICNPLTQNIHQQARPQIEAFQKANQPEGELGDRVMQ